MGKKACFVSCLLVALLAVGSAQFSNTGNANNDLMTLALLSGQGMGSSSLETMAMMNLLGRRSGSGSTGASSSSPSVPVGFGSTVPKTTGAGSNPNLAALLTQSQQGGATAGTSGQQRGNGLFGALGMMGPMAFGTSLSDIAEMNACMSLYRPGISRVMRMMYLSICNGNVY